MNEIEAEKDKATTYRSSGKFSNIFLMAALLLMMLPFISTFNEFLTSLFLKWELYRLLQNFIVPYEAKVIAGLLNTVGLSAEAVSKGVWVRALFIEIQWNCLGWQSGVLLAASFITGFQGHFTKESRLEVIIIGLLGTYLVNIFRLFFTGVLTVSIDDSIGLFFHDYLALVLVIAWFILFWYMSYSFVLEEKSN